MFSFVSFAIVILNRKEFGSTIKLILIGALAFLASQAIKMLIFAMVFPAIDESAASFDPMQDALRKIVDLVDIFTARYALNYIKGGGNETLFYKLYSVTLGWAGVQTFLSYFFFILINAFSSEFQWDCIQTAVKCNLDLVIVNLYIVQCIHNHEIGYSLK